MIPRRAFLRNGGLAAIGMSLVPGFLQRVAAAVPEGRKKTLVVVFLRGAADGLNIVVPFGEKAYYAHRPTIAVPKPSKDENAALDLDGFFGFHPALRPLLPLYKDKDARLAIINAVGQPETGGRSHFQAQDLMESATGNKDLTSGWLNRYLTSTPDAAASSFRATAVAPAVPKALLGPAPVLALQDLAKFEIGGGALFEQLYTQDTNSAFARPAQEMFESIKRLKALRLEDYRPAAGVNYGQGEFGPALMQVAQLIKAEVGLQVACVDFRGGWDTHSDEMGRLPGLLRGLAQGLDAFNRDLGDRMNDVVLLTMSEFGRTARENGSGGSDHGHANFMFVMGGSVHGGKIYGKWPGLEKEQLNEDRDLALTTDYRDVLAEVIVKHLGCEKLDTVFPRHTIDPAKALGII